MRDIDLNDYVCIKPFISLEVHQGANFLCCASWLKKHLPKNVEPKDSWESEDANEIRKSVIDGTYRYCDKKQCPYLQQLIMFGKVGNTNTLHHKDELPIELKDKIDKLIKGEKFPPETIQFSFDKTCNLKCPSCRVDLITENSKGVIRVKKTIDDIEKEYGTTTKNLYITGTGDPFVSVGFRDFLRNFDSKKWPLLNKIHFHTNATKWNKKMWESMPNIHKYIKTCEISIDAATKDTYENKVRLGGNWDELIDNLKFISTIPSLKNIKTSFVVQQKNYKEMKMFYELMISIFGKKLSAYYGKITNWGTFNEDEYLKHKIWDINHPEHLEFLEEVNSFIPQDQIWHNLQEFIYNKKTII